MMFTANIAMAADGSGFSLAGDKFGQVNIKVGIDLESEVKGTFEGEYMGMDILQVENQPSDHGFTLGTEYLSPLLLNMFKGGIGIQYAFPRTSWGRRA